jgi:hypothetical protein
VNSGCQESLLPLPVVVLAGQQAVAERAADFAVEDGVLAVVGRVAGEDPLRTVRMERGPEFAAHPRWPDV